MKIDNREILGKSAWSFYPDGWSNNWGNAGYNTRRDLFRTVYLQGRHQVVEWTEGGRVIERDEIMQMVEMTRDKTSRAFLQRNKYSNG